MAPPNPVALNSPPRPRTPSQSLQAPQALTAAAAPRPPVAAAPQVPSQLLQPPRPSHLLQPPAPSQSLQQPPKCPLHCSLAGALQPKQSLQLPLTIAAAPKPS